MTGLLPRYLYITPYLKSVHGFPVRVLELDLLGPWWIAESPVRLSVYDNYRSNAELGLT